MKKRSNCVDVMAAKPHWEDIFKQFDNIFLYNILWNHTVKWSNVIQCLRCVCEDTYPEFWIILFILNWLQRLTWIVHGLNTIWNLTGLWLSVWLIFSQSQWEMVQPDGSICCGDEEHGGGYFQWKCVADFHLFPFGNEIRTCSVTTVTKSHNDVKRHKNLGRRQTLDVNGFAWTAARNYVIELLSYNS